MAHGILIVLVILLRIQHARPTEDRARGVLGCPHLVVEVLTWVLKVPVFVPLGVGTATQAPLIALIANPPDESTRTAMLESWCAADYCTLLGGGAGYSPGAGGFVGNYVPPDDDFARERDAILAEAARGSGS